MYHTGKREDSIFCCCGKDIGIDKGSCFKMIATAFISRGVKRNRQGFSSASMLLVFS